MSEKPVLVIKDGCVVTGDAKDSRFERADVVIRGNKIEAIGPNAGAAHPGAETIDASDSVVMPGLINAHLHSNEGFEQGAYDNLPLEPWLLRIAVNVCRDTARRQRRRQHTFVEAAAEPIDGASDPCAGLERQQERVILQRALDLLPEKERLAIMLRDIEGLSTAEVAAILQSSETTVRSQVSRGRLRLKAAVDRMMGGES